jgi:hypothetical protein
LASEAASRTLFCPLKTGSIAAVKAQFVQAIVEKAERIRTREAFEQQRMRDGTYPAPQLESPWTPEMDAEFEEWLRTYKAGPVGRCPVGLSRTRAGAQGLLGPRR